MIWYARNLKKPGFAGDGVPPTELQMAVTSSDGPAISVVPVSIAEREASFDVEI